jgi:hypothetical protein
MRRTLQAIADQAWHRAPSDTVSASSPAVAAAAAFFDALQMLSPVNDAQRVVKDRALQLAISLGQMRYLLYVQSGRSIPLPLLAVLVFWLAICFGSYGLLSRPNATSVTMLVVSAVSAAGAIFLILELDQPFSGLIAISSDPLRNALATIGS